MVVKSAFEGEHHELHGAESFLRIERILIYMQEIAPVLWILGVHYRIYNSPPPDHILSPINPVHALQSNSLKIFFNNIFPYA
jgi:hypothetical protein